MEEMTTWAQSDLGKNRSSRTGERQQCKVYIVLK